MLVLTPFSRRALRRPSRRSLLKPPRGCNASCCNAQGIPPQLTDPLPFGGQTFVFASDVTDQVDPSTLIGIGCAADDFPSPRHSVGPASYTDVIAIVAGRLLRFTAAEAAPVDNSRNYPDRIRLSGHHRGNAVCQPIRPPRARRQRTRRPKPQSPPIRPPKRRSQRTRPPRPRCQPIRQRKLPRLLTRPPKRRTTPQRRRRFPPETPTDTPTATATPIPPTDTPTETATETPTAIPSDTPTNTPTATPCHRHSTQTAVPTETPTATAVPTDTPTVAPTDTASPTPTDTPTLPPTATSTVTPTETATPAPTETATATPSEVVPAAATSLASPTEVATAPASPVIPNVQVSATAVTSPTATSTTAPTTTAAFPCQGTGGAVDASGLPAGLPRTVSFSGETYVFVAQQATVNAARLQVVGCAGGFEIVQSTEVSAAQAIYLRLASAPQTLYRCEAASRITLQTVTDVQVAVAASQFAPVVVASVAPAAPAPCPGAVSSAGGSGLPADLPRIVQVDGRTYAFVAQENLTVSVQVQQIGCASGSRWCSLRRLT